MKYELRLLYVREAPISLLQPGVRGSVTLVPGAVDTNARQDEAHIPMVAAT